MVGRSLTNRIYYLLSRAGRSSRPILTIPRGRRDVSRDEEKSLDRTPHPFVSKLPSSILSAPGSEIFSAYDPNFDSESVLEDDSPYPEVRSAVANYDDPDMPASTLRAWTLGICWAVIIPGMNQFFYFRYPSVAIGSLVAQLLVFPLGRAWARLFPNMTIFGIEINPGPFSIKEHVLVTIMAGVGAQTAYATDIIAVQRVYYHQVFPFAYQWLLVMSTQLIGFSIGGVARRFLVNPPSMIWPNTLVSCALFNTLHSQSYAGIGEHEGMSRERYFLYAFLGALLWYFVPGYLFQALSVFTWVCWAAPGNVKLNQMFGYRSGLGFSLLTFDWNEIAFIGSPLATPWWAEANVMIGFVLFYWFLTPILYYNNVWYSQYMPISSINAYDNTGKIYDLERIIDDAASIRVSEYKQYSPVYLSITFVISYGLSFLSIAATITHAIIHFWKPIKVQFKQSLREAPDIHARLMAKYPQVPEWYYACIFVVTFTFACVCIQVWPAGMTIWALVIGLIVSVIYVIPIGMIQAVTNRQIGLNVITELIIGFIIPGKPNAMMMFKTYGYITMSQAMQFTADFKLGHYMKVPPRPMFWCQVVATVIAGTVQLLVMSWLFENVEDLCDKEQKDNFTCNSTRVFGTASIIWGVIGPALQFSKGQIYYILNYLNFPLIFSGVGSIPPATAVNYVPWAIIGFLFQFVVRRRNFSYWAKYNYVLSAALDAGTAIGVIIIFFCLQYPLRGTIGQNTIRSWWGNQVFRDTADWRSTPLKTLPEGQTFGPSFATSAPQR
ncbi:putative OPT oligopeptide transporter protein [Lyophyllum shimeji]|uniref:OPT oligopeptide transporter protein n=1 Tax=Lyophyllum shimeji TaxID=47721 RepID=A0A9P3PTC4_LYOSH|nr:putative OPT oligopeptide transporter protein [Lyophyllum shimeji]